uniref:Putative secreted protein n=1 Tax=Anopheles darlingi TaxID=43151 RepID=A0A2M4DM14_ANODA
MLPALFFLFFVRFASFRFVSFFLVHPFTTHIIRQPLLPPFPFCDDEGGGTPPSVHTYPHNLLPYGRRLSG